jgi:hypothetical protein
MPPKPAIPHPANKVMVLKMSLLSGGIFLDESLFFVALESTDETMPPMDPLVVVVLVAAAVIVEPKEIVTLSISPAGPVGTGCPSCEDRYQRLPN